MDKAPERIWADPDHWLARKPRRSGYTEYTRTDISNALIAAGVKVKPLVWADQQNGSVGTMADGGVYMIFNQWGSKLFYCATGQLPECCYPTLEAAKEAAQADYERRIRSALAPDDARAAYDAAIRAAKIEGMREAVKIALDHKPDRPLASRVTAGSIERAITALIEETEKGGV